MPIINIIKGGWNNIIKIIFAIYSLSEYSKSLLKLQMNVLHAKKVGVEESGRSSERSINNGLQSVFDGKLERALNRVQAYVKAREYT